MARRRFLVPVLLAPLLGLGLGTGVGGCRPSGGDPAPGAPPGSGAGAGGSGAATAGRAASPPPDILLVTLDTLRADRLGFLGDEAARTPVLDRLAAQGRVFPNARAHNVVTLPSHANILTGRLPPGHGVRENSGYVLPDSVPTLATILAGRGYATAAVVGAFPLDSRFGLGRGFATYDDRYPLGSRPDQFLMAQRRGDEVVDRALAFWTAPGADSRPRFLWVHLYDPHAPYEPPPPFRAGFAADPYRGEIAATDAFLAPLLEPLLARGAEAASTLVVVTADHGEALGEHEELTHGLFGYEATLRVPLVLWGRGVEPGRDGRAARHIDLLPTILEHAGIPAPPGLDGRSLFAPAPAPAPAPGAALPEAASDLYFEALSAHLNRGWAPLRGVVAGRHKLIDLPLPELYDLEADPAESRNLADTERRLLRELRQRLPSEPWPPRRQAAIDDEERQRLAALGYLVGDGGAKERYGPEDDPKNLVRLDRQLQEMVKAYAEGDYLEAIRRGRAVIAERPTMPETYETAALALRQLERHDEAIALLRQALAAGARRESLMRELGMALAENGKAGDAVAVLEPLRDSADPASINALAVALTDAGRADEAAGLLEALIRRVPADAKGRENLGIALLRLDRVAEAIQALEAALDRNPSLPIAWNTLGVARYRSGDAAAAIAAWQRAVDLDPRQWDALFNLGLVAAESRRFGEARRALERFASSAPPSRAADARRARSILQSLPAGGPP